MICLAALASAYASPMSQGPRAAIWSHPPQLRAHTPLLTVQAQPPRRGADLRQAPPPQPQSPLASAGFLLGAAALWGTYPSTIKCFFNSPGSAISPGEVTLLRFLVMALASTAAYLFAGGDVAAREAKECVLDGDACSPDAPWREQFERRVPSSVYLAAGELGAIGLAGSYCNTVGLAQISGLTGAILLTFLNIFVPLIGAVAGATEEERSVDSSTWLASSVALAASIYALRPDTPAGAAAAAAVGGGDGSWFADLVLPSIGSSELAVLAAAFFFAASKVRLSSHLKVHGADLLVTGRIVAQAGLAAAGLGLLDETNLVHELLPSQQGGMGMDIVQVIGQAEGWITGVSPQQIFWIVSSALLSGAAALWCQGRGQSAVSAPRAQLFFSTSPLFAALWALLLLQEPITNHELVGGAALVLGLVAASQVTAREEAQASGSADASR